MRSAKLFILGIERELLWVNTNYYRFTAGDGSITSDVNGGMLTVSFVSQEDDDCFIHNMTKEVEKETDRMEKGEIHFYNKGDEDSPVRKYKFRDAYLIQFSETFYAFGTGNMQTVLTISPAIQDYGKELIKPWQVSWLPPSEPNYYTPKEEEDRVVYINGHFYNTEGIFEGKVNNNANSGNVEDVYVCEGKGKEKDTFLNIKKLDITHENFCYIAGVIKAEDSSTFESAAATTQATFNAVKFEKGSDLAMGEQSKFAKKLLATDYSSVSSKTALDDSKKNTEDKNARKGLIHVLQGKKDYSEGAVLWDGIDFADKGINHNKATKDGGISITKELWVKFINSCEYKPDSKGVLRLYRHTGINHDKDKTKTEALATIPFEEKKVVTSTSNELYVFEPFPSQNTDWNFPTGSQDEKNIDYYETEGTNKFNKGMTLNKATVVAGRHIFWKAYKENPKNKGYYWKSFMNRL
ncbi:type VI secretion system tube protein TssD [Flavobacterium aestivum]|uniref:type VI secretion system tube protein TssD n=1 Tax=Flavobacterium aestivum TaxID=3003257 RepID=UPI0024828064|nr:type VI secretion system tube protein TssD [Flavobacterium aestivum]